MLLFLQGKIKTGIWSINYRGFKNIGLPAFRSFIF
jgi:hypothetical protein